MKTKKILESYDNDDKVSGEKQSRKQADNYSIPRPPTRQDM